MPVYNSNGGYYDATDKAESWNFDLFADNPMGVMVNKNKNLNKNHRMMANVSLSIQPIKDLIFKSAFGYKLNAVSKRELYPTV